MLTLLHVHRSLHTHKPILASLSMSYGQVAVAQALTAQESMTAG